jgi:hypothetical protein
MVLPLAAGRPGRTATPVTVSAQSSRMASVTEPRHARPCDCAGHHRRFAPHPLGGTQIVPVMHQHEDGWCASLCSGCPGLPHCRDWILGSYRFAESLATIRGDGARALEIQISREEREREFARRVPVEQLVHEPEAACPP